MADSTNANHRAKRRRILPLVWIAGAAAATLLGLTISGTLSGFTASIKNTTNTTGSGTLLMQESNNAGTVSCYSNGATAGAAVGATNSNTCATINKFGGDTTAGSNLAPGATAVATVVKIKNAGTIDAGQFTLTPDPTCTQSNNTTNTGVIANGSASDFCTKVNVVIKQGATTIFSGTAAQLATGIGAATPLPANLGPVTAGSTATMEFDVSLDATASNAYQGLSLSLPLTWKFTQ